MSRQHWWERSSYLILHKCLKKLLNRLLKNKSKLVFIPRLGYGVDGLEWDHVKKIINYTFRRTKIKFIALSFQNSKKTLFTSPPPKKLSSRKTAYNLNKSLLWFTKITNR